MNAKILMLGKRNQITLPREFIPEETTLMQCERREDGSLLLTPQVSIPANQAYFWTKRWQEGEREASEDIRSGRLHRHQSADELLTRLNRRRRK